jgi:formylglycine-generating enzyme required for sulfatase activity
VVVIAASSSGGVQELWDKVRPLSAEEEQALYAEAIGLQGEVTALRKQLDNSQREIENQKRDNISDIRRLQGNIRSVRNNNEKELLQQELDELETEQQRLEEYSRLVNEQILGGQDSITQEGQIQVAAALIRDKDFEQAGKILEPIKQQLKELGIQIDAAEQIQKVLEVFKQNKTAWLTYYMRYRSFVDEFTLSEERLEEYLFNHQFSHAISEYKKLGDKYVQHLNHEKKENQKKYLVLASELELVSIPAGSFLMGSSDNRTPHFGEAGPVHKVSLKEFLLMKHEVTFEQYDLYAEETGKDKPSDNGWGRGKRPVINVNWNEATAYAEWLSQETGLKFRLPSETEWEYAARAGSTTNYSWGISIGINNANCNGCGSQWDNTKTAPVGNFKANNFGLKDMHGNVFEWVQDCWNLTYIGTAPLDGSAWMKGDCTRRVLRGGSWLGRPGSLRSADRSGFYPDGRSNYYGFRLLQEL